MAHYYDGGRAHRQPTPATSTSAPASNRPAPSNRPALSNGQVPRQQSLRPGDTARIDCDTCPIAGRGCGDCMVALLGPVRFRLDEVEQSAVDLLRARGLVTAEEADRAYATPDLPDWVEALHDRDDEIPAERMRAIG